MQKIDKTDTLETILTRGKFEVDYYQREYRWGRKQIEQMLMDFYDTFRQYYDPANHGAPSEVQKYGYCKESTWKTIICIMRSSAWRA